MENERRSLPMSISPMRYSSFMRPVASPGQHRISTIFVLICEVVASLAPLETMTPLPYLTG